MPPLPELTGLLPHKRHILGLHSSKAKIQWGWMENQEGTSPGGGWAALLSLSHKGLSKISHQEEAKFPSPKKNSFSVGFPAQLELGGCARPCSVPAQAAPTVRDAGPSYSDSAEPQMPPAPGQRHHTVTDCEWGTHLGEQHSDQLPFDVGTLRIPIPLGNLLHSLTFHLQESQTLTHLGGLSHHPLPPQSSKPDPGQLMAEGRKTFS